MTFINQAQIKATIITADITDIASSTALQEEILLMMVDATVIARGVCFSLSALPTIDDFITTDGTGTGNFTSEITGLDP